MLTFFRAGGFAMIPILVLGIALLITAINFARHADPQRLALIRALTVAIAFLSIIGMVVGFATTAHRIVENEEWLKDPLPYLLQGFAESVTCVILGGSCAVVSWTLVAVGVRRMPE